MRRRSDYPAYLALRAAVAGLQALPRGAAVRAAEWLGGVAHSPLGLRRGVAEENLAVAFPERSAEERADICRRMYRHWGRMTVGSLLTALDDAPSAPPDPPGGAEAIRLVHGLLDRGRGLLILTAHLGNWEGAAVYAGSRGVPISAVWKPQANPYIAAYLDRLRSRLGIDAIPMPEAREGVVAALRAGRAVALVADQAPIRSGTWVPFFGRPTKTFNGPGHFAAQTGAPVIFGAMLGDGGGFRVHAEVLVDAPSPDAAAMVRCVATRYRARLEALIRTAPEQYLWTHRLWRHQPPDGLGGA